jgi:hypothetical protein
MDSAHTALRFARKCLNRESLAARIFFRQLLQQQAETPKQFTRVLIFPGFFSALLNLEKFQGCCLVLTSSGMLCYNVLAHFCGTRID